MIHHWTSKQKHRTEHAWEPSMHSDPQPKNSTQHNPQPKTYRRKQRPHLTSKACNLELNHGVHCAPQVLLAKLPVWVHLKKLAHCTNAECGFSNTGRSAGQTGVRPSKGTPANQCLRGEHSVHSLSKMCSLRQCQVLLPVHRQVCRSSRRAAQQGIPAALDGLLLIAGR